MTLADRGLDLLPEGVTVLEASAGTGKTHRVTTEAVRAIAAGTPLEQMLLVTFTIAATSELRARTWDRLSRTAAALEAHLHGTPLDTDDELVAELCAGDEAEVAARQQNLADAMASFDGATITTIHGFCHQVLQSLGFAADVERDPTFVEDVRDMLDEVVADLLVRKLHRAAGVTFPLDLARRIADRATVDPRARIVPDGEGVDTTRVRFASAVRDEMGRRKRATGLLGYDDLLLRVEEALVEDPEGTVRDRLRHRYTLVIVDEFQDTDAVQWEILERAFGDPPTRLVLVGDPKQAIYAFRGADVHAYLAARRRAGDDNVRRLDRSWRADAGVLRGLDSLFGDTALGHDEIRYASTTAAPGREATRIEGLAKPTPVRLRLVGSDRPGLNLTPSSGVVQKDSGICFVAEDLASDVVALLSQGATYDDPDAGERPLQCGDVAVLVSRNQDALTVRDALVRAGVPAVVNGTGSVFGTGAARAWLAVLEAVERPAATGVVRNAALTPLLGWTAAEVDAADERAWDALHDRLHDWHRLLAVGNVAGLFEQLSAHTDLPARLLRIEGGERTVTDIRHLASLLHAQAGLGGGAPSLLAWLRERMREVDRDAAQDDRSRRLETDDQAVQVWTIHRSKGLEYPVVYVPYLWVPPPARAEDVLVFHDETSGQRVIDVSDPKGAGAADRAEHARRYLDEEAGGALRLAYVALTRARSQVVLWWVRGHDCHRSPLGRLLLGAERAQDRGVKLRDEDCRSAADLLAQRSGGTVAVEPASGSSGARLERRVPDGPRLRTASFDRTIDRAWRRTSYSALTAAAHDAPDAHAADVVEEPEAPAGTAPEHDERGLEDERMPEDLPVAGDRADAETEARLRAVASPFGDLGGGATFGTLVHGVLEDVDFAAADLPRQIRTALGAQYLGDQQVDADALVAGLVAAIETPLGPLVDHLRLRDVGRRDRLDELHFELPLVGGDDPTGHVTMDAIADVVSRHLPADDPLAGYGDRLRSPALAAQVRGHLSGSIDVVLRHDGRYVVIDHKSNWLGVAGEELSAWHYRPSALSDAMVRAHYPLQALLYAVALHRYLRWRLPDHDPERDLGGVLYLFLRGMTGADVPRVDGQPCGVFAWQPPAALVVGLSDVLDRGRPVTVLAGRQVHDAAGTLGTFADAGVLEAADVHVARALGRLGGVPDGPDGDAVLLAVALTVRAVRLGSVVADLATLAGTVTVDDGPLGVDGGPPPDLDELPWPDPGAWVDAVRSSPLVAVGDDAPADRPLRLVGTGLALDRYWRHERRIVADLTTRAATEPSDVDLDLLRDGLGRLFPGAPSSGPDLQRVAAAAAVLRSCTVIAGGPGTGKTTTVARILALLHEQAAADGRPMRAALAAPTGKAAARLQEAVQDQAAQLERDGTVPADVAAAVAASEASTLHRLLGWNPGNRSRFRHDRTNQLPHQVVVVDETSMVSLSMMARLLEAVRPSARLVLVGDPQQLASVEAGAVLGDVVGPTADRLRMRPAARTHLEEASGQVVDADDDDRPASIGDGIVVLRHNHRFAGGIRELASAIQTGRDDDVVQVLGRGSHDVRWLPVDVAETSAGDAAARAAAVTEVRDLVVAQAADVIAAAADGRAADALASMRGVQLLCAHRRGPYGVATWRREIERRLAETVPGFAWQGWFAGRPLLITENDRQLGLYNGDTGVVVDDDGTLRCAFERRGEVVHVSPSRLAAVETLYAMTIHKSQGSQFGQVVVVLPDEASPILTRELLYTAVTRAERGVTVVGTEAAVRAAASRPVSRASGLRDRLWS